MNNLDLNIYLPESTGLTELAIVPDFPQLNPLIQRAVCLLVAHEDPGLCINSIPLTSFIQQVTNSNVGTISQMLSAPADRLMYLMNADEITVDSIEFLVSNDNGKLSVDINITPHNAENSVASTLYRQV